MTIDQQSEQRDAPRAGEAANGLPDIASDRAKSNVGALDWVGMDAIDLPIRIADGDSDMRVPARVSAEVDLAVGVARGIHMSRLYLGLDAAIVAPLSPIMLDGLLREFLASHAGLSTRARVRFAFEHFLRRPALASEHSGWRRYPVVVTALRDGDGLSIDIAFDVVYSSTCPASTALARQLVAEDFGRAFPAGAPIDRDSAVRWLAGEHGMRATPHSQRSTASIRVRLDATIAALPFTALIERAEVALGTPVQTAVKRIDEQAFSRRNGENQMFCEDAARRLQAAFDVEPCVRDFHLRVAHHESLHAHDAVAETGKSMPQSGPTHG